MRRVFSMTDSDSLVDLKKIEFDTEKSLQNMMESKISSIFKNLIFLKSEFKVGSFYTDTLAFDTDKNCFVIIEYKNRKNLTLFDQVFAYFGKLKTNPDKFILEYIVKFGKTDPDSFNLDESYMIIISPKYTEYQKNAIDGIKMIKELRRKINLYQISRYEKNFIILDELTDKGSKQYPTSKDKKIITKIEPISLSRNESTYLNGDYYGAPSDETRRLYEIFKRKMSKEFPDFVINVTRVYISFFADSIDYRFCTVNIQKNKLIVCFDLPPNFDQKFDSIIDVSDKGKWGIGNSRFDIESESNIDKIISYFAVLFWDFLGPDSDNPDEYDAMMEMLLDSALTQTQDQ